MTQRAASLWHPGVGVMKRLGRSDLTSAPPATYTPLPTQPFAVAYGDPMVLNGSQWSHAGAMVVPGRASYSDSIFPAIAAAGGTVLVYIDTIVSNTYGRYHGLIMNSSAYGPAVPKWPGPINANSTGDLLDFRATSSLHATATDSTYGPLGYTKLEAVLELCVAENPHMGGFFADDLGSRSYFPNFDWATWTTTAQQQYRDGAIAVAQAFRRVCDRHGLMLVVNGTWQAGTLAARGGGYPDMNINGLSLAEGGTWEHHNYDSFGATYITGPQWAIGTPTAGQRFCCVMAADSNLGTGGDLKAWRDANIVAWLSSAGSSSQYGGVAPWSTTAWHVTGAPTHAS